MNAQWAGTQEFLMDRKVMRPTSASLLMTRSAMREIIGVMPNSPADSVSDEDLSKYGALFR
jgi:hypothetical protein